jgi:O-acetyl-ADP-ribose deacetylase
VHDNKMKKPIPVQQWKRPVSVWTPAFFLWRLPAEGITGIIQPCPVWVIRHISKRETATGNRLENPMKRDALDRITIRMGDITQVEVDAVVNAANSTLLGGGGVDGMIHWAAGSGLLEECRAIGWCPTGEARITGGYNLPARHVIHTVGPVYGIDGENSPRLLASCYESSLALASDNWVRTVSFPAISCGAYGYPVSEACRIALDTTVGFLEIHDFPEKVIFVLHSCRDYDVYREYYVSKRDATAGNTE